ncbi:hypothetical protein OVA10_12045 [Lelliottia sp. SL45]|jgi:hypothetical protein|uniref:hypothetical protein n=1 Tax=Lelliottia TaxID=1330545 RepID=UPI000F9F5B73|nr:hypothetical protein [Lelliottia sp. SL45]MCY1698778.1 hypothetical protein [Lelliottia sp. SL45]
MKKAAFFIGILFISFLMAGCHSVYKTLRIEPFDFYRTDMEYIRVTPDLTIKYPAPGHALIRIEDPPEYARLAVDLGSNMGYHGYTDKTLLPAWDALFDRFLVWQSSPGDVEVVSAVVKTKEYSGYIDKDVEFVNIKGVKYLVFVSHYWLTPDVLIAYDEENVRKMKVLYRNLNSSLIEK